MDKKAAIITIKGRVQFVAFRSFVVKWAKKLDISGYAKNLPNKSVEILAQATENNIKDFENILRKGPILSNVKSVNVKEVEPQNIKGFKKL